MAEPMSMRRRRGFSIAFRIADAGCSMSDVITAAETMKSASSAPSIAYSRQGNGGRVMELERLARRAVFGLHQIRAAGSAPKQAVGHEHVEQPFDAGLIQVP